MRSSHDFGAGRRLIASLAIAALALGCRKSEKPAASMTAAGPAAATPAPSAEAGPSIRDTPEANRPPFSGLRAARGAAVDDRGRLWVTDFEHAAIRLFDASGGFLGGWGSRGDGPYQLKDPCGIAIHGDDVYVADTWNGRVLHFSLAGRALGKAPGDFYGPRGIAVAPDGRVWIADTGNERIVICDRDLTNPRLITKKEGSGPEDLSSPVGIATGASGRVYVADTGNRRIQVLDADGKFRTRLPFKGWGPNTEPYLAVDDEENIFASDPAGQAVVMLDKNGRELKRWTEDSAGRKFAKPTGLALDRKKGTLYVVNTDSDTIATLKLQK